MVAGGVMSAVGASMHKCSGEDHASCLSAHWGLLAGGFLGVSGLAGSLTLGLGLRGWRRSFVDESPEGLRNPAMFGVGVAATTLGAGAMAAGFLMSVTSACLMSDPPICSYGSFYPAGPVLLATGAPVLAAGAPLLALGRGGGDTGLEVDVSAGGGTLRYAF
jgi:hypothetical protein